MSRSTVPRPSLKGWASRHTALMAERTAMQRELREIERRIARLERRTT